MFVLFIRCLFKGRNLSICTELRKLEILLLLKEPGTWNGQKIADILYVRLLMLIFGIVWTLIWLLLASNWFLFLLFLIFYPPNSLHYGTHYECQDKNRSVLALFCPEATLHREIDHFFQTPIIMTNYLPSMVAL